MPELAEVAYACGQWNPGIGKFIKEVYANPSSRVYRDLSWELVVRALRGAKLTSSATHGKQMLFKFSGNRWLGLHLGMTGSLQTVNSSYTQIKQDALLLVQSKQTLVFRDPRQFGRVRLHIGKEAPSWWSELPISMIDSKFQSGILNDAIKRHSKRPIKALLLDQRYFQGMGNWMADEVLWRAHIHPAQRCANISSSGRKELFKQIKFVTKGAMNSVGKHGGDPPKGWLFHVRWKNGGFCPKTNTALLREEIGGRTSCWSPRLQKL